MALKLKPLSEQTIIITGASSGIGLSTARMAAKAGSKVVLTARNEEALITICDEMTKEGGKATYVVADVGIEEDIEKIKAQAIEAFGGFDTWVNNAGVTIFGGTDQVSIPDMRRMFDTNFWGVVYGSRAAVSHYKENKRPGAIINVGSFFGDRGVVLQSTYAASKHAVHGFTEAMRMELEKEKAPISLTLIHAGRIDTPYNEHARNYMEEVPSHRIMVYLPEAVADAILFAASHPKRDMYVGFQAKILAIASALSPRLMDKFMEAYGYRFQKSDRPAESKAEDALYHPSYGLHERGTNKGINRKRSLYVQLEKLFGM
jgi:short-subunit dehydrogenase